MIHEILCFLGLKIGDRLGITNVETVADIERIFAADAERHQREHLRAVRSHIQDNVDSLS